ncbi:iron ABC transporter permease [Butyrivibrio fibrisolvens]|uniref:FecCD family ABC transporter permease n=1 Tax=Pseudobutyrivibrio TaxID=46205 RepID=UPI00041A36B0|nr:MULTISPECIES: iron ABC transporter permease [Pseudobutyrivibrio]MDC7279689.1 iron ABC transporter permease [Butyrivibrio fibrisolvens]SFN41081.1 iron complex transport system permease protein [Pseudobutyrivibrio sp. UC1225]
MKQNNKIKTITLIGILLLFISVILSITYGAKSVGLSDVIDALLGRNLEDYNVNVVQARLPRTLFGIIAGASLSISGVLMQSITRNPIADPSILGVNTGASLFIVFGISFFNIQSKLSYIGLAFVGALLTSIFVYRLASLGYSGATPIKLAISGAAISTALSSLISIIVMPDSSVMTSFRFWQIGSIGGTSTDDILLLLPFTVLAIVVSFLLSDNLDTMLLSEETAIALGLNIGRTRILAALCGVLLCACTTALAGPISFIGLMIPHLIRSSIGSSHKPLIILSGIYGGAILIISDVLGRILGAPGELESGIMTALIGAPVFIYIIRKAKLQSL